VVVNSLVKFNTQPVLAARDERKMFICDELSELDDPWRGPYD